MKSKNHNLKGTVTLNIYSIHISTYTVPILFIYKLYRCKRNTVIGLSSINNYHIQFYQTCTFIKKYSIEFSYLMLPTYVQVNIESLPMDDLIRTAVEKNDPVLLICNLRERWASYQPIVSEIKKLSERYLIYEFKQTYYYM